MLKITTAILCLGLAIIMSTCGGQMAQQVSADGLIITVSDMTGLQLLRPVTGGVPLAQGIAPEGSRFSLFDDRGDPVPLQTSVLARWNDGSARWVLLDFQSDPPPNGVLQYRLACGSEAAMLPAAPASEPASGSVNP